MITYKIWITRCLNCGGVQEGKNCECEKCESFNVVNDTMVTTQAPEYSYNIIKVRGKKEALSVKKK